MRNTCNSTSPPLQTCLIINNKFDYNKPNVDIWNISIKCHNATKSTNNIVKINSYVQFQILLIFL